VTTYDLGDGVNLEHLVYDRDNELTAATVVLTVTAPDGTTSTPSLTNPSTGRYVADTVIPDQVGGWSGAWMVTGAVTDLVTFAFTVADPAPPAYTDITTVKAALGKTTDDDRDDLISAAIIAGARWIDRRCGRRFYADLAATARVFRPGRRVSCDGSDAVLRVDDFATTAGLIVETATGIGGTWTAVATQEAGPDNADSYGQPWNRIRAPGAWIPYTGKVRITARWGWPAVPDDITQANTLLASRLYRRKDSPQGVLGNAEWGAIRVSRMDPDVEALIAPFMIPLVA